MSESWKSGYRKALYNYVLRNGTGNYIIEEREQESHLRSCAVDYTKSQLEESSWDRYWDDSLYDGDTVLEHGVDAEITCACGEVEGLRLRVRASIGQILLDILNLPDEEG